MAVEALCPTCGAVFNLKEDFLGKKVRCKKCEHIFTVGGESRARERDDSESVQSRSGSAPKKSARDDDDDRPRKGSSRRDRDDDDDRPTRKKSRAGRDDDDDDDRSSSKRNKRVYHDDDDNDDEDFKTPARKKSGGGSGMVIAIVGGVVLVLLLLCGGGIYGIYRMTAAVADAADQAQQDLVNNVNNAQFDPNAGVWGFDKQPHDLNEALTFLKSADVNERRGAANWLSKQQVEAGRQKEVATAVEPVVKELDAGSIAAGTRALQRLGHPRQRPGPDPGAAARARGGHPRRQRQGTDGRHRPREV